VRGSLFSITVLALAALLGLPMVARAAPDRHPSAAAPQAAAPAAGWQVITDSGGAQVDDLGQLVIHPLPISTSQPGHVVNNASDVVFGPAGDIGQLGIPTMVLRAYQLAAARLAVEQASCHLPWWLLAGIGHTESGHAESGRLYPDGTTRGRILGPVLDGTLADNAVIHDTDHGVYDGDPFYDRAVGPMQFIPSTWVHWAADGNHDGRRDPNNIYDATLAAGRYLCADHRNLATMPGLAAAVLAYNHSQAYLATVLAWGLAYRNGASAVADLVAPVVSDVTEVRPPLSARPPAKPVKISPTSSAPASSAAGSSPAGSPTATESTPASSSAASSSAASSSAASSSAASSSAAGSSSASPTASCTSPAASSSAAPSSSTSASAAAHSDSGQPASPASSADGGSATISASAAAAGQSSSATATPSNSATCTP
jgi:membrane-bound lytic murein transglycosylase B